MVNTRKTKAQLIDELEALQAKIASLERSKNAPRPGSDYVFAVAENAPVGIALYRQGIALYVNQTYARMAGYSDSSELVGKHFVDGVAPPYLMKPSV
jgi:PAS domain-containing protein